METGKGSKFTMLSRVTFCEFPLLSQGALACQRADDTLDQDLCFPMPCFQ